MDREESERLQKKDRELRKLINLQALTVKPLHADFDRAAQEWNLDRTSQFWGRTSIRCLCATIDATLFTFRKMAEQLAVVSNIQFDPKEAEILAEKRLVKENGVERTRPKFLPLQDSVKESFRLFGKAIGVPVKIQFDDGYDSLCATFDLRNRLMHPKNVFDVEVRESDLQVADKAIHWFNKTYLDVIHQCQAELSVRVERQIAELGQRGKA
jgi:hypothetical protein